MNASKYHFIIDSNERGEFRARVTRTVGDHSDPHNGEGIYHMSNEDEGTYCAIPEIEQGFMENLKDMKGLAEVVGVPFIHYVG